ncbi:MAG: HEAT repeat domain-containing protein [Candidatus Methylomirabilis oxyfera]|nr:HEAT repeat domain-containing protein [Candidatus Methylomirabilis oxyfera]
MCLILAGWGCTAAGLSGQAKERSASKAINVEALDPVVRDPARSDRVRMKIAKELAASTDPKALDPIFSVIRDRQTRPLLRATLIRLLGRSPQREAVAAFLLERLADEQEATEVRSAAATSLGVLKDTSNESLAQLRRAGDDADPAVRLAARSALVRIGGEGIDPVSLLIAILQDPAQPDAAKVSAAERVGAFKDGRARQALIQALGAKSPDGPPPHTLQEFFAARAAVKRNLPAAAARALGRLGDPIAIPSLIDAAEQTQGEAKVAVFEALAALRASQAVPTARKALWDPDQRVRRWAAVLLQEVGAREALPELHRALADTDPGVRLQAALTLEKFNDRESVQQIKDALSKETIPEVRQAMEQAVRTLSPQ